MKTSVFTTLLQGWAVARHDFRHCALHLQHVRRQNSFSGLPHLEISSPLGSPQEPNGFLLGALRDQIRAILGILVPAWFPDGSQAPKGGIWGHFGVSF